ncbi:TIGR01459 family HAD-type hydrolase [Maricaulis sp.]|uniref:TIGR01459 family HAD-type hydrolase n=1 Tax=Maricaulis sp. TaxID=1486257 RepID=UPI002629FDCD|nr:TIGR01459 family HAD-type hydrolase [Maricaulis sp.]
MISRATLSDLAPHYSAIFCDVWGVIRDGHALIPDAVKALQRYRAEGGTVCLVSNSPRRAPSLLHSLEEMGLPDDATDTVVTSGDAIYAELVARAPGKALRIGPDWDDALYAGLGLEFVSVEEAQFITCTGPDDYWDGKPEDYDAVLRTALERNLDLVCANPDIVVQAGDRLIYCAGAIARHYRAMGGTSIVAGKPHRPIYGLAFEALKRVGWSGSAEQVLAIGDGPETDIAGADRAGIDALFIADGILGAEMQDDGFDPEAVALSLSAYGVAARWGARQLVWSD